MKRAVSVILILALVFSILALPAQAVALGTGLLIGVTATSVVASALIGLGVLPGSDGSVFDGIVNDAVAHLQSLGFGDGTTIPVLKYLGSGGGIRYALQTVVLTALRSWLFAEDVVVSDLYPYTTFTASPPLNPLDSSGSAVTYNFRSDVSCSGFYYFYYTDSSNIRTFTMIRSSGPGTLAFGSGKSLSLQNFNGIYGSVSTLNNGVLYSGYTDAIFLGSFDSSIGVSPWTSSFYHYFLSLIPSSLSSPFDVSLGDVVPEDEEISVAYPSWGYGTVEIPPSGDDEDPDPFIPVTLLPTYDETKGLTQDQAQSGESSLQTDNNGTSVDISGDIGGSITPGGDAGDLPSGDGAVTVDDLTTMFAWLAVRIDEAVQSLFPDLQVIKTYLKTIAQWHETENVKYDSMLSYFSGWDTDFDTMLTNLSNIDLNLTTLVDHAGSSVDLLSAIASDVQDIRDVIADPLDGDINEEEQDNKNAFLNTFSKKSQADNIGDLSGLSDGFTEWFSLDVDPSLLFDQMDTGFGPWFTSETAQSISVGGGAAAAGIGVGLMDDVEYVEPDTPYLDAYTQEVQDILAGGDGEW